MAAVATRPAKAEAKIRTEQEKQALAATKPQNDQRLQLHQDGVPFILPSRRGINSLADGFDPESFMDLVSEDVMFIQHEKLREVLEVQADVEYLRRHGLEGRTDVESFRKCIPVVSYSDLEADIMRLVNGEKAPIFTVDPITNFTFSSGTTAGTPKFIPTTARSFENYLFVLEFVGSIYGRDFPGFKDGKALSLAFAGKQIDTPSGIKAGVSSTNYFRSPRFQNRPRISNAEHSFCVPDEVILADDTDQAMYCHLLCVLAQAPEIVKVYATFAATIVAAMRTLQKRWHEIVEDIRTGTLNEKITEPPLRSAVQKTLEPNPDLASTIEKECSKEDWEGIIPRLFPNARFVACVISGSMLQYAPALRYFSGHLSTISPVYAAAECSFIGLNPNMKCAPENITYMLWPETAYYEFIPLGDEGSGRNGEGSNIVEARDLEVGKEYELVVTNVIGLYRYRIGDVIRVKGFRKSAPIFEFVRRKNVILSVHTDKTDEEELQAVVNKAAGLLRGTRMELALVDYTSSTNISSLPGHYIIFWEIVNSRDLDDDVLQECANTLDANFNNSYRKWRAGNQIGPLELCIVEEGTFDKVMASAVARGAGPSQYKPPRCVNHPQALEILKVGAVTSFHSRIIPDPTPSTGLSGIQTSR